MPVLSKPPESRIWVYESTPVMHALPGLSNSGATAENAGKPACFKLSIRRRRKKTPGPRLPGGKTGLSQDLKKGLSLDA
jgi:hypothetical protein